MNDDTRGHGRSQAQQHAGRGKPAEAQHPNHGRSVEAQAGKVYEFAGDADHPAGQVNIVRREAHGEVVVVPVGGGAEFQVHRRTLAGLEDEPEPGVEPSEGSETGQ